MSKTTMRKKARRKKRQASCDARWIPEDVLDDVADDLDLAEVLEYFDELVTRRHLRATMSLKRLG